MNNSVPFYKPIVTLSWDDGHPLDMRIARLMANNGLAATFYVPTEIRPRLDDYQLVDLRAMGMEIGSHGVTHSVLTSSRELGRELIESRDKLEQTIQRAVSSFCYPFGRFSAQVMRSVRLAGYRLARTTVAFRIGRDFNRFLMPVTIQFARHSHQIHLRHAVRQANVRGMFTWGFRLNFETELLQLARLAFDEAYRQNGIFHLWGHSWEIDDLALWETLTEVCKYIARRSDVIYAPNQSCVAGEVSR